VTTDAVSTSVFAKKARLQAVGFPTKGCRTRTDHRAPVRARREEGVTIHAATSAELTICRDNCEVVLS
jgi:hypothetical protein